MSTEQEAAAAMGKLNGSTHEGRTLVVSEARPMEGGGRSGGGGARSGVADAVVLRRRWWFFKRGGGDR